MDEVPEAAEHRMAKKMHVLDDIDRRILRALQKDGRLTIVELSEQVGLSSTPCWTRLRRLESEGYITQYAAILDQKKLGYPDTALVEVTLDKHDEKVLAEFGRQLTSLPVVLEAYLTTGGYDYHIKVAVDGTAGYERFLRERLYRIPGIRHSRSSFALRCLKRILSVEP
jgi:Lrp/AsnC family leucine-responsive transcriptional regulator